MLRGRGRGRWLGEPPDLARGSRGRSLPVEFDPAEFPLVDASWVERVISGEYNLESQMKRQGLAPHGTTPSLEACRSIDVSGLPENATEEELRTLCSESGTVTDVKLRKSKADGGPGCATITFDSASAAQQAQKSLQRTILHGKEIEVGLDLDKDGKHHWLHVWINKDVTARKLYDGFLKAGAPCIDARVVRKSPDEGSGGGWGSGLQD